MRFPESVESHRPPLPSRLIQCDRHSGPIHEGEALRSDDRPQRRGQAAAPRSAVKGEPLGLPGRTERVNSAVFCRRRAAWIAPWWAFGRTGPSGVMVNGREHRAEDNACQYENDAPGAEITEERGSELAHALVPKMATGFVP
jgi:hypothetical protein